MLFRSYAGEEAPEGTDQTFPDVPTSHNYYRAVQWAYENGITTGYQSGSNAGLFGVHDTCTRGQCIMFLYRIMN